MKSPAFSAWWPLTGALIHPDPDPEHAHGTGVTPLTGAILHPEHAHGHVSGREAGHSH